MVDLDEIVSDYVKVFLRLQRLMDDRMKQEGVSYARTKLLLYLDRVGAGRAIDLAGFFSQAPRTITEAIDRLERDGLVQRGPDPNDRRAKLVSITDAGRRAVATTEPLRRHLIEKLFSVLSDSECDQLSRLTGKLLIALDIEEARGDCS